MAQLVIAFAGAAIGGALAPVGFTFLGLKGAALGWMAGSMLGSMLAPTQRSAGPRLEELRVSGTEYGGGIAWIAGAPRVAGDLIWASDRREIATTEEVGKGGGSEYTSYTYELDALYLLADQPDAIVTRCWENGKLIWTNLASADDASRLASEQTTKWRRITVYSGPDAQLPDPTYDAAVTNAPGYTRRLCVFIEGLQLGTSGTLPNLTFEVVSSGDTNPNFERRYAVADTGVQFADTYTTADGRPAILSMLPTVRVGVLNSNTVYVFDLEGALTATTTRELSENYPGGAGSNGGGLTSYPVGILGGLPVRAMNMGLAFNAASEHLMAGWATAAAVGIGFATPFTDGITQTRFLGQVALCSDGVHALVMTSPSNPVGGASVIDRWHLIHFDGTTVTNVSEGDIEDPITINQLGFGNSTTYHFGCCALEDDLKHVWWAYGAGSGNVSMYKIEADGVLRLRSILEDGAGLQQRSFTFPSVWAEGGYCVAVSRQSYQAFRRVGDAISDVPLQDAVEALCDRATMPAGTYDASALAGITQPVRALAVSNGSARQALEILQSSHGFDAYVTDKLYFVPRGGASVLTVNVDDLAAGDGDAQAEPFALTVNSDLEIPSRIAVVFKNMSADQINGTEHSERGPTGQDSIQTIQLAIGMTPGEAKGVADAMVRDAYASRITSQLSLPMTYTHLTPTDVIQVPGSDAALYRMRITRRSDSGGIMTLDVVGDDGAVVVEEMTTSGGYTAQVIVEALALTELALLDIPLLRDADDAPGHYVAARGTTSVWPGAVVLASSNGVDYSTAATVNESAVLGVCTTTLGAWSGGYVFDEINSITVNLAHGEVSSTTRDTLLSSATINSILIGSEVVRFVDAQLLSASPNVYKLTRLLRGQRGTEWAMASHVGGERAVLLRTAGLRKVSAQASDRGQARDFKGVTLGMSAADIFAISFTNTDVCLKPFAPVNLRAAYAGPGTATLTWARRSRLSCRLASPAGMSCPLGEASERYRVELRDASDVLVGASEVATTEVTVSTVQVVTPSGFATSSGIARSQEYAGSIFGAKASPNSFAGVLNASTGEFLQLSGSAALPSLVYDDEQAYLLDNVVGLVGRNLYRVDLSTTLAVAAVVATTATAHCFGSAAVWTVSLSDGNLRRHNATTLAVLSTVSFGASASKVAQDGSLVFAAGQFSDLTYGFAALDATSPHAEVWRVVGATPYAMHAVNGLLFIATALNVEVRDATDGSLLTTYSDNPWNGSSVYSAPTFVPVSGGVLYTMATGATSTIRVLSDTTGALVTDILLPVNGICVGKFGSDYLVTFKDPQNENQLTVRYSVDGSLAGYVAIVEQLGAGDIRGYPTSITL